MKGIEPSINGLVKGNTIRKAVCFYPRSDGRFLILVALSQFGIDGQRFDQVGPC